MQFVSGGKDLEYCQGCAALALPLTIPAKSSRLQSVRKVAPFHLSGVPPRGVRGGTQSEPMWAKRLGLMKARSSCAATNANANNSIAQWAIAINAVGAFINSNVGT